MIANCGSDENGKITGGKAGDQTGKEWRLRAWYNRPWNYVLRHPDPAIREKIADMAEKAAKNDKIGYDQGLNGHSDQRLSFWTELKKVDYDPAKIQTACETDCSASTAAIVKGVGYLTGSSKLKAVSAYMCTSDERETLKKAGFEVLSEKKYLTSDKYLVRGDILLYEGHHTAINLTDGEEVKTVTISVPVLRKGDKNNYVKFIQRNLKARDWKGKDGKPLAIDGSFGGNTEDAVRRFQKYKGLTVTGIVDEAAWNAIISA